MDDKEWIEGIKNIGPYGGLIVAVVCSMRAYDSYYPEWFYWIIQVVLLIIFIVSLVCVIKGIKIMDKRIKHNLVEGISKDPKKYSEANIVYEKIYGNNKSSSTSGEMMGGNLHIENDKTSETSSTSINI